MKSMNGYDQNRHAVTAFTLLSIQVRAVFVGALVERRPRSVTICYNEDSVLKISGKGKDLQSRRSFEASGDGFVFSYFSSDAPVIDEVHAQGADGHLFRWLRARKGLDLLLAGHADCPLARMTPREVWKACNEIESLCSRLGIYLPAVHNSGGTEFAPAINPHLVPKTEA